LDVVQHTFQHFGRRFNVFSVVVMPVLPNAPFARLLAERLNITTTASNPRVLAITGFAIGSDSLPVVRGRQAVDF
jgi:hypothetical protein